MYHLTFTDLISKAFMKARDLTQNAAIRNMA